MPAIIDEIMLNGLEERRDFYFLGVVNYDRRLLRWKHPQTKKSLARCSYERKMISAFTALLTSVTLSLHETLSATDMEGKTLVDDLQENPPSPEEFQKIISSCESQKGAEKASEIHWVLQSILANKSSPKYEKGLILYSAKQTTEEFTQSTLHSAVNEAFRRAMELDKFFFRYTAFRVDSTLILIPLIRLLLLT